MDGSGTVLLISHLPPNQDLLSFCRVANQALGAFEWNDKKLRMIGKILLCLLWNWEAHSDADVLSGLINDFFTVDIEAPFDNFIESALVQWFLPANSWRISLNRLSYMIDTLQGVLALYWPTVLEAPEHLLYAEFTT